MFNRLCTEVISPIKVSAGKWSFSILVKLGRRLCILSKVLLEPNSKALLFDCISKNKTVIHLAALIGIPYSYISPLAYIRTNIEGTYNVLESAKNLRVDCIVFSLMKKNWIH